MTVTVELNTDKLRGKIEERLTHTQLALDNEVLKDDNYYVPFREGTLMRSGHIPEPGTVEWDEEYSRWQYYNGPNKSKDLNPNATMLWHEHSAARNMKKWEKVANEEYNR